MTAKQEQALAALMTYPTRKEAAAAAGINERTLRGYFQNKEFRERYRGMCFEIMEDAALRSKVILDKSLSTLEEAVTCQDLNMAVRVQAAHKAADIALRLDDSVNIRRELAELREIILPESEEPNDIA